MNFHIFMQQINQLLGQGNYNGAVELASQQYGNQAIENCFHQISIYSKKDILSFLSHQITHDTERIAHGLSNDQHALNDHVNYFNKILQASPHYFYYDWDAHEYDGTFKDFELRDIITKLENKN